MTTPQLLTALEWRYATKVFDPNKKISTDLWQALERALVLSPSSYGLQPYRFLVIQDAAKRAALLPHSWNQKQVVDSSHYIVFASRTKMTEVDIDRFLALTSQVRDLPAGALSTYRGMMVGDLVTGPRSKIAHEWATRQAYIALGNLMTCAAVLGVDTCPMEGLEPAAYDEILGLSGQGYGTVCACAAGYRAAFDKYATTPKVRFKASELISHV